MANSAERVLAWHFPPKNPQVHRPHCFGLANLLGEPLVAMAAGRGTLACLVLLKQLICRRAEHSVDDLALRVIADCDEAALRDRLLLGFVPFLDADLIHLMTSVG